MFDNMGNAAQFAGHQNSSSFHQSDVNRTMGVESTSNEGSQNGSENGVSESDKVIEESKRFMNYLKTVKNIVPTFKDNENTNKLIGIMEELKKTDTNEPISFIDKIRQADASNNLLSDSNQTNTYSFKDNMNTVSADNFAFQTPEGHSRYSAQPKMEEEKSTQKQIKIPESQNLNFANNKLRQAYNSLVFNTDGSEAKNGNYANNNVRQAYNGSVYNTDGSGSHNSQEDLTNLKGDQLSQLVKSSQK